MMTNTGLELFESKKAKTRNRYHQVPHLTQGTIWVRDKNTSMCGPRGGGGDRGPDPPEKLQKYRVP